jgi:hypothetical protein
VAPGLEEQFGIEVADTVVASVDVERTSELITVVITGEAPGTTQIVARWLPDNEIAAVVGVDVLRKTTRTVNLAAVAAPGQAIPVMPDAGDTEEYLNNVWALQANVWFDVTSNGSRVVDFENYPSNQNVDGLVQRAGFGQFGLTSEQSRIDAAARNPNSQINVYFIQAFNPVGAGAIAVAEANVFIQQDTASADKKYILAHELGHCLGIWDPDHCNSSKKNLMCWLVLSDEPTEIRRQDWKQVDRN